MNHDLFDIRKYFWPLNLPKFAKNVTKRHHKALSSVIGATIFLILALGSFGAIYAAFQFQTNLTQDQKLSFDKTSKKIEENFSISPTYDYTNDRISIQVTNNGENTIEISQMWYIDQYGTYDLTPIPLNVVDRIIPSYTTKQLITNQNTPDSDSNYEIKISTKLGNSKTVTIPCSTCLSAEFFSTNKQIDDGEEVTFVLIVTNTAQTDQHNIEATLPVISNPSPNFAADLTDTLFNNFEPRSAVQSVDLLKAGQSATFIWKAKIEGKSAIPLGDYAIVTTSVSSDEVLQFSKSIQVMVTSESDFLAKLRISVVPQPPGKSGVFSFSGDLGEFNITSTGGTSSAGVFRVHPTTVYNVTLTGFSNSGWTFDGVGCTINAPVIDLPKRSFDTTTGIAGTTQDCDITLGN